MKFFKFFALALLCICLTAGSVFAQRQTGAITGTVLDVDGNPLPGVTVEVSSPSLLGGVQAQFTSTKGSYRFINLPPGTYKLVFKLEGFTTLERENVRLSVAKTITENITLQQAAIEESVVVTAAAPIVDVTQSGHSFHFDKDALEKLPTGRNSVYDIVKFAPGLTQTWQESTYSVSHGSGAEASIYQMDGIGLTSTWSGGSFLDVTSEAFEEVETFGVGAPAEFGQYTGAVINILTKSGGNRFSGTASYYGQFQRLTADNNPDPVLDHNIPLEEAENYPGQFYSYRIKKYYSANLTFGGPILYDRLWFYGAFERQEYGVSYWGMFPGAAIVEPRNKGFFKLSFQLAPQHKLVGSFYYEDFESLDYAYYYEAPSVRGKSEGASYAWNFGYTWQLSNDAFIDLKYAGFSADSDYGPLSGDWETSPIWDFDGTEYGGLGSAASFWKTSRHQASASLTYFAEDFLGGDHEFKVGAQYYRGDSRYPTGYIGEKWYYNDNGAPYAMYQQDVYHVGGVIDSISAFVDDSWKIGDRLTLNLGLRFDYSNGHIPELPVMDYFTPTSETTPAVKDIVVWNNIAPRIGLVYQLTSDQKTLLKASYGRYYDALLMSNWTEPGPNVTDWNVFKWDASIQDYVFWYSYSDASTYKMDPDLKTPYADLFSLSLERELLPDLGIELTLIHKRMEDLMGMEGRESTYEEVSMVSPDNGQTYTLFNQTNVGVKQVWFTNPAAYEQRYNAAMLTLKKRYAHNWMLGISLTYSKSEGLTTIAHKDSARQYSTVARGGSYGSDPNDFINAYGRLANDRPWVLKVQTAYSFPWGILASANWIYQTGRPDPSFTGFRLDQGFRRVLAEARGPDRFPNWSMLDLRLQKTFHIGDRVRFSTIFDVWNVFNANTDTYWASHRMYSSLYKGRDWLFYPRRLQIGFKLEF